MQQRIGDEGEERSLQLRGRATEQAEGVSALLSHLKDAGAPGPAHTRVASCGILVYFSLDRKLDRELIRLCG